VIPEEVAALYRDVRPYVSLCRFPNCTHTHEEDCAVKDAVADGRLDLGFRIARYVDKAEIKQ
jgi:ribosome biogenesis GTPase